MLTINFSPFPILETERLILRRVLPSDVKEMFELRSNPETMKYIPRPLVTNYDEALAHIKMMEDKIETNEGINWAITIKGDDKMLGVIGHYRIKPEHYRAEVGYMILPEYQGDGAATVALDEIIKLAADKKKKAVRLDAIGTNVPAQKLYEKYGFVNCGTAQEYYESTGETEFV